MAKNDLVEAPLGRPAAQPLLKRRCHSDVSTPSSDGDLICFMSILSICLFICGIAQYPVCSTFACKTKTSRVRAAAVYRGSTSSLLVKHRIRSRKVDQLKGDVAPILLPRRQQSCFPPSRGKFSALAPLIIRSVLKTLLFALQ